MQAPTASITAASPRAGAAGAATRVAHARRYIPEFDVLRGTAIVFVVYLHAYFSPWDVTPHSEVLAMHIIHLFAQTAVPVFFFMSAFLFAGDSSPSFARYAVAKVRRVVIPMLFWMTLALFYRVWREGGLTEYLWHHYLLFDIAGQYYYLVVLAILMVAFFFVRDWPVERLGVLAVAAFAVNLATIYYYQSSTIHGTFATLAYRNPLVWVFFYAFGLYAGRRFGTLEWTRPLLWPALAGMACVAAVYFVLGEGYGIWSVSYFAVTIFLFSCFSLVAYPALVYHVMRTAAGMFALRPAVFLSRYAFAIYLVHMPFFVGYLTNRFISPWTAVNTEWFLLMNSLFIFGFVTATAFVVLMGALLPRLSAELLGINPKRLEPRVKAAQAGSAEA